MRHEQSGHAAPSDPTPRPERPVPTRALLCLIFLVASLAAATAMGTREQDPVLAQARTDIAAARASVAAARGQKDQLKAAQLYQDASQRYQVIADNLNARLLSGKDPGNRIRGLLTSVLLDKAQIDRELKNYDASIASLTAVIREDPDRFDQANGRIREIIAIREKYAQIAADLFNNIKTKDMSLPANQDYVRQRTVELQNLDPYGNQDILIRISEAILKSQNLRAMRSIMTQARALLDAGRFDDTFAVYQKGFDIYRQQYEDSGYDLLDEQSGRVLVATADGTLANLALAQDGTLLKTDKNGDIMKRPDGTPLPLLDAQGRPQKLNFLLAGGKKRLETGEGSVVEYAESTVNGAASLADSVRRAEGGLSSLAQAAQQLQGAFAQGDPTAIEAGWQPLQSALADLLHAYVDMDRVGKRLEDLDRQLPKKRGGKDISYIQYAYPSYADLFIRGRPPASDYDRLDSFGDPTWRPVAERDKPEGMAGAILSEYDSYLVALQAAFEPVLDGAYRDAVAKLESQDWEEAKAEFDRLGTLSGQARRVLALWKQAYAIDPDANLSARAKAIVDQKSADAERIGRLGELAAGYSRLCTVALDLRSAVDQGRTYLGSLPPNPQLTVVFAWYRDLDGSIAAIRSRISSLASDNGGLVADMAKWAGAGLDDPRATGANAAYAAHIAAIMNFAHLQMRDLLSQTADLLTNGLATQLPACTDAVQSAEAMIAGPESTLPDRTGLRDPTASKAAALLATQQKSIASLQSLVAAGIKLIGQEDPAMLAEPQVKSRLDSLTGDQATLSQLEARRVQDLAAAQGKIKAAVEASAAADAALAEARRLLGASQAKGVAPAIASRDLDQSKARLADALAKILEWSQEDFDPQRWNDYYNNQYGKLKSDRDQAEEAYVLNETFRLLDEGQRYYNQQLYDLAGESLDTAQQLWLSKHSDEQPQVKYWQNFVKMAQDTNNKREVKQSEPLYYDISNYLSQARALYDRGDGFMKAGDKAAATAAFDAARQNISYVTRAFPLNAEAGLLTLQILKATDQVAYDQSLPSRIQATRDLLASDPQTAYSRIADLAKMEPKNATIQGLLKQAEIKTGRRPPEPTREQLARAASLVSEAEGLMKTGRSSDNARASTLLNQAYALDPGNTKALNDIKYLTVLSGKGTVAGPGLAPADQALLDTATGQYAGGQYNQARDTLNRLLQAGRMTKDVLKLDQSLKQLGY